MAYSLLAQATMVAHFVFLTYLLVGGFLAWRRRWRASIWLHGAVVAWGVSIVTVGQECPLTHVENWARRAAGGQDLAGGFIDTYLTDVVYPGEYLTETRLVVAAVVLASWIGWWRLAARSRRSVAEPRA